MNHRRKPIEHKPKHHEAMHWILEFSRTLIYLNDAGKPFQVEDPVLDQWRVFRTDLMECSTPLMHYGSTVVYQDGVSLTHETLIWAVNALVDELRFRNWGMGQREITLAEIDNVRNLAFELSRCVERVVFY